MKDQILDLKQSNVVFRVQFVNTYESDDITCAFINE